MKNTNKIMNGKFYSIIVPTHNKKEDLQKCLLGILDQDFDGRKIELIVIDDGSRDGTKEAIKRLNNDSIEFRYIRLEGYGPAKARNIGISHARGEVVCMVDDDAVPQERWFMELIKPFENQNDVIGVEGKVVPSGEDHGPLGMSPVNDSGGVFLTCNIAYRRNILLKVGGFDEGFPFPAFEDTDLAAQMKKYGRIVWAPDAVVHHPRRRWSLKRALREIKFYKSLLRYARRYEAMGWEGRKTRHPICRTIWSAIIAMPIGRVLKGFKALKTYPIQSVEFIFISLAQGLAATLLIWPPVLEALRKPLAPRQSSLFTHSVSILSA